MTDIRRPQRLRASAALGVSSLALVGALSACGSVDAKLAARDAANSLKDSQTASFTLHFDDPKGELASLATTDGDRRGAAAVTAGSLRIVVDPAGERTLGQTTDVSAAPSTDIAKSLRKSGSMEIAYIDKGADVVTLRVIDGTAYAKVDLPKLRNITGEKLDPSALAAGAPEIFSSVIDGLQAGKWLSLDLATAYEKADKAGLIKGLPAAISTPPSLDPAVVKSFANDLLAAVKANSVTSQRSGKDSAVLVDVSVKAKAALLSVIDLLGQPKYAELFKTPGASVLTDRLDAMRAGVAKLPDTPVKGTLTVKDKHLEQAALDLASVVALGNDAESKQKITSARLLVDIDDAADTVSAPAANQSVQLDSLVDLALTQVGSLAGA